MLDLTLFNYSKIPIHNKCLFSNTYSIDGPVNFTFILSLQTVPVSVNDNNNDNNDINDNNNNKPFIYNWWRNY